MLAVQELEAADPGARHDGDVLARLARLEARVLEALERRDQRELREARGALERARRDAMLGIEVEHFARDAAAERRGVEQRDRADPRAAGDERVPELSDAGADRRRDAEARDEHARVHGFTRGRGRRRC